MIWRARNYRQIRRYDAKEGLGVLAAARLVVIKSPTLSPVEQQILLDLVFRQAQVAQAVVAHRHEAAWQFRQ